MSAKVNELYRKSIRHAIIKQYPAQTSKEIFAALKNPDLHDLFFENLYYLCDELEIPKESLQNVFASYGIYSNRITEDKFIHFIEDEVTCKAIQKRIPKKLTDEQIAILSKLANSIRTHRTQATPSKKAGLCSERPSYSQQWIFLTRLNYNRGESARIRISSLCHYASDLNLSFSAEQLIDALFTFFEEKVDSIDFEHFTHYMETF